LQIDICGGDDLSYRELSFGFQQWQASLRDRLNLNLKRSSHCAPFSDLNQHTIHVVQSYMVEANQKISVLGQTLTVMSANRGQMVDADMFVFEAEIKKAGNLDQFIPGTELTIYTANKLLTFIHELGHMLGLDHKFDGTVSVMAYEKTSLQLTPYDLAAIQALYPLKWMDLSKF
jgi:hypothetical protein